MNLTVIATGFDSVDGGTTAARPVSKPSAAAPASAPVEADDEESDVKKDDGISEEDFGDIINILKKSPMRIPCIGVFLYSGSKKSSVYYRTDSVWDIDNSDSCIELRII